MMCLKNYNVELLFNENSIQIDVFSYVLFNKKIEKNVKIKECKND